MLLDLIADEFEPHQRRIEDGLVFQLEVLEALEKAQKEVETVKSAAQVSAASAAVTAATPSKMRSILVSSLTNIPLDKKRVSMADRLKGKKVKVEL